MARMVWKIPALKFKDTWEVKIIPPFVGAMARFIVNEGSASVSIFLDVNSSLGSYGGEPYWEIYPYDDDIGRWAMLDTIGLLSGIEDSINEQNGIKVVEIKNRARRTLLSNYTIFDEESG
jgi:hypothetical protein